MVSIRTLTLAAAGFIYSVNGDHLMVADIHSASSCGGNVNTLFTDVSINYCFKNAHGVTVSKAGFGKTQEKCGNFELTVYKNGDCTGTSTVYTNAIRDCERPGVSPFKSVRLRCY